MDHGSRIGRRKRCAGDHAPPLLFPQGRQDEGAVYGKLEEADTIVRVGGAIEVSLQAIERTGRDDRGLPEPALNLFETVLGEQIREFPGPLFRSRIHGDRYEHGEQLTGKRLVCQTTLVTGMISAEYYK